MTGEVVWRPQPGPQTALLKCPVFEVFFGGARGGGKGVLFDQGVVTPRGIVKAGDLKVGDVISAIDGGTTRVLGIFDRGMQQCYRVTFSDGRSLICDGDHRWPVRFPGTASSKAHGGFDNWKPHNTESLYKRCLHRKTKRSKNNPQLPKLSPVKFDSLGPCSIDPYILGLLLGDGSIKDGGKKRAISIGTRHEGVAKYLVGKGWGYRVRQDVSVPFFDCRVHGDNLRVLIDDLKDVGLHGTDSYTKFIPEIYLRASIEDRFSLIQGLMDTDGSIGQDGCAVYDSVNERLIDGVRFLAESLGAQCTLKKREQKVRVGSFGKNLAPYIYRLSIRMPDNSVLFRCSDKILKVKKSTENPSKKIIDISPVGFCHTMCIKVDHPQEIFVLEGFIPTMNTDGMLGEWACHAQQYGENAIGLFIRRELAQLDETIERAKQIYLPIGAKWQEAKKQFTFPNGARVKFRYLENDSDAEKYQGQSFTRVYIEELTNFPSMEPINKLKATLRSGAGVPCCFRATGNPGGSGHTAVKARYIDPAPEGYKIIKEEFKNPFTGEVTIRDRVFIPSKVSENKYLGGDYVANLQMQGNEALVRAWLNGDWDIVSGAAFEKLDRSKHCVRPFEMPDWWTRFTALDWGSSKPYAVGWFAVADETTLVKGREHWPDVVIPKGSLIAYRELYGWNGKANEGAKQESWEVAAKIHDCEMPDERIAYRIADSAMWAEHDGPSIAENMSKALASIGARCPTMEKSRKDRMANYNEIRNRISAVDGEKPGLFVFATCEHFWRTVPSLQLDVRNPEKGWDTAQEDHWADMLGYACASRPTLITREQFIESEYRSAQNRAKNNRGSYSRY